MVKNGLFLLSIGFLIFLYAINPTTGAYRIPSIILALLLWIIGVYLMLKGRKNNGMDEKRGDK